MLRTTVIPDKIAYQLQILLPEHYVGKEVEVIVFAKDEGVQGEVSSDKRISFTVLKTNGKPYKFNREEANER
jgi:hypothetical protein